MKADKNNFLENITNPTTNSWVAANAGSGKTYVLSQKVIRLLLSGTNPSHILCLTYTKSAAAEMKSRIFENLRKWVHLTDDELQANVQNVTGVITTPNSLYLARTLFARALETPGGLKIETIHAFCERVLQQFPFEAPVPSNFNLIDDAQSNVLWQSAFTKIYNAGLEKSHPLHENVNCVMNFLGEYNFEKQLKTMLAKRGQLMQLMRVVQDETSLKMMYQNALDLPEHISFTMLEQKFLQFPFNDSQWLIQTAQVMQKGNKNDKSRAQILFKIITQKTWQLKYELALELVETKTGELRKNPFTSDEIKSCAPELVRLFNSALQDLIEFRASYNKFFTLQTSMSCCRLATELLKHYQNLKLQQRLLDFDDLILKTRDLLTNNSLSFVQYRLDSSIDHILLDEAQDTSAEQWDIMTQIAQDFHSGESARTVTRTIFVVGDEKQSIYRFQGAMPEHFHNMKLKYSSDVAAVNGKWCEEPLEISYRSTQDILHAVDLVFNHQNLNAHLTQSAKQTHHITNRTSAFGVVELYPLCYTPEKDALAPIWTTPSEKQYGVHSSTKTAVQTLVTQIVGAVQNLLNTPNLIEEKDAINGKTITRNVHAGDILILVQKRKHIFEAVMKGLRDAKLPVAGADKLILSNHIAVQDLLILADVMYMPADDLSLATVLKSPIFCLDENDIFSIAYDRKTSLWESLELHANDNPLWLRAYELLKFAHAHARHTRPYEFYAHILRNTAFTFSFSQGQENYTIWQSFISRMGADIQEILEEFLNIILQYEQHNVPSLFGFVQWMRSTEHKLNREMSEAGHTIRVLTVHNAKGLEAPIVMLAETCLAHNPQDVPLILPVPFNDVILPIATQSNTDIKILKNAKLVRKSQDYAEKLRLLYVAMTRARDRLLIFGAINARQNNPEVIAKTWYGLIQNGLQNWPKNNEFSINSLQTEYGDVLQYRATKASLTAEKPDPFSIPITDPPQKVSPIKFHDANITTPISVRDFIIKLCATSKMPSFDETSQHIVGTHNHAETLSSIERGIIIHKLFELAPKIPDLTYIIQLLENEKRSKQQTEAIAKQILEELKTLNYEPKFADILRGTLYKEVPIIGQYQHYSEVVSGRIDLLSVFENKIYVVDYKTDFLPPLDKNKIPQAHILQLQIYGNIIQTLYPNHTIHPVIVYVKNAKLYEISITNT